MSDIDQNTFEKGKTVIRLKGVKIVKQDFPLNGVVFQDSVLEINPCSNDIPLAMRDWMAL
ncbi:hypothetical protein DAPPUDRAFT_332499 [Daphnia pulex]|uniref:Uncharacterized protein n=1 Tax=Daphnia pulex TaxID=6669 RepID=E9HQ49_DAPPU|nr:hypothetical protein DAPPUDRAFT_332499 [Daphnia pulex]|eukprot:EFX66132.1 hypothetical protein DAPPUDRAFT_332499 [Daphnia pulex]